MSKSSPRSAAIESNLSIKPPLSTILLNPGAVEFKSSASSGSTTPDYRSTTSEDETVVRTKRSSQRSSSLRHLDYQNIPYPPNSGHYHSVKGWESPQAVLPPSPSYSHKVSKHDMKDSVCAERDDLDDSAPDMVDGMPPTHYDDRSSSPPAILHPGMMAPGYGWGPQYHPYYIYHPDIALERSSSPPPVYTMSGGSPPLAPGFLSVPLSIPMHRSGSMSGGSPVPGGSPMYGSSPPHGMGPPHLVSGSPPPGGGHYVYYNHMHPQYHHHAPPHSEMHRAHSSDELAQQMASMNVKGTITAPGQCDNGVGDGSGLVKPGPSETRASARIARSNRAGGAYNPNDFTFKVEEAEEAGDNGRTTVMIRNIPNKYTQRMMLSILEKSGFKGSFDFFYLPIDFRNRCNLGYAFINFVNPLTTIKLYKEFHDKRWDEYNSKKVCQVTYGRVQGQQSLIEHFKASKFPSDDIQYQPLVYTVEENGRCGRPASIHEFLGTASHASIDGNDNEEASKDCN